jgi:hypothetical protein
MYHRFFVILSLFILICYGETTLSEPTAEKGRAPRYPWSYADTSIPIIARFSPPPGYRRIIPPIGSFARWLQQLPVKAGRPPVKLFNGALKNRQDVHAAVLDIDVGERDLQQCADAVMRLWAEYLRSIRRDDLICFKTAAGGKVRWSKWRSGYRLSEHTPKTWEKRAVPSGSYRTFRQYLKKVFSVANSASILGQMSRVENQKAIQYGDIFIEGATHRRYGHAVIVVDVAENIDGEQVFLIAQSYMPAQEIHILKNPSNSKSPWYHPSDDGSLGTPEWRFGPAALHRFRKNGC